MGVVYMLYVVKRDGREVEFNAEKISSAINSAAAEIGVNLKASENLSILQKIIKYIEINNDDRITVEQVQNLVEKALKDSKL